MNGGSNPVFVQTLVQVQAFEHELDQTLPSHHEALERAQSRILTRILELRLACGSSWDYITIAQTAAKDILDADFRDLFGSLIDDVAQGEIARLIGECTIDWDAPRDSNG